jgi:serine/threonine protein kinase
VALSLLIQVDKQKMSYKYDSKSQFYDCKEDRDTNASPSSLIPAWANVNFKEIELGERISGGGVGIIYKGWYKNQQVALKTLFDARISSDLKKEYMDELLVMSKLNHSNIVKFLGASMTPPNLCFIMELCDTSLFQILHIDRIKLSIPEKFQAAVS